MGDVKYFHNREGRGLEDWTAKPVFAAAGTGWWRAIATADFTATAGRLRRRHLGLNTRYHATSAATRSALSRRLRRTAPFAIEGYYENGRLYRG